MKIDKKKRRSRNFASFASFCSNLLSFHRTTLDEYPFLRIFVKHLSFSFLCLFVAKDLSLPLSFIPPCLRGEIPVLLTSKFGM
jgi:hypothetical protein